MNKYAIALILTGVTMVLAAIIGSITGQSQQETAEPEPTETPITLSPSLTAIPATLQWGNLSRGETVTRTVTLTNMGYAPTEPLNMTSTCLVGTVLWNAENTTLPARSSISVAFYLRVSPTAPSGPFSFDIKVTG